MNIFLLRGLVREKAHWGKFVQELEEAFPSDNIITPEIQGVGQFVDIISPTNFDAMVEFMRDQYLTQIESGEECILIAMSLGGIIARLWMEKHPQDFSKCILVNTSFKGISHIHERLRPLSILNFFKIFLTPSIEKREKAIIKMVSNNDTNHDEIIKEWIEIQKKRPVKRQNFLNQMKAAMVTTTVYRENIVREIWWDTFSDIRITKRAFLWNSHPVVTGNAVVLKTPWR